MGRENKRRSFLKYLLSLMAFSTGSIFSYKENRSLKIGTTGLINMGSSEAQAMVSGVRVKKIAIEEHCFGQDFNTLDKRLKDMDEGGIDMQVLNSMIQIQGSAAEIVTSYKKINEDLCKVVEKYPERFAAFISLPMQDPDTAARELERGVKELGLKAPFIFAGQDGSYLDEKKFWGIYEIAEKLDVPIYVHPGPAIGDIMKPYSTYPILTSSMWGFAVVTSLHAMRLILSGVFDKYPNLKIILGHLGESIPYWLWRLDNRWSKEKDMYKSDIELKRTPSQYFKENFYITTSGMCWHPVLNFVNSVLGADRILFAVDYPQESNLIAAQFIDSMQISDEDKEKICHLNAEKLLRI